MIIQRMRLLAAGSGIGCKWFSFAAEVSLPNKAREEKGWTRAQSKKVAGGGTRRRSRLKTPDIFDSAQKDGLNRCGLI